MTIKRPIIFGEVLFDCFDDGSVVMGGAPFNVAWNLHALGAWPLFVSRVGDDELGRRILHTMQQRGMDTAGVQIDFTHPTGEVRVRISANEPSFEIVPEQAYDQIVAEHLPNLSTNLIYHGSLITRSQASRSALDRLLADTQAPVFLDVNLRAPWWDRDNVLQQVERARWVKLNDAELTLLSRSEGSPEEQALSMLKRHGLELIIVTRGAEGAFAIDVNEGITTVSPSAATEVVDTVGAGDAFASVCILGILKKWSLQTTLERAQAYASAIVGLRGATTMDDKFYAAFAWNPATQQ